MKYHSTRGTGQYSFKDILFRGLAEDGGLFVPVSLPKFDINKYDKTVNYNDLAFDILSLFIGDDLSENDLRDIIKDTYSDAFSSQNYVTYKNIDKSIIVELFNGPTLAFKDFAMQLLIPMFDHFLKNEDKRVNLIVATSGDTGSAAIHAVNKSKNLNIHCLYPKNRISEFQRRQMSTVKSNKIWQSCRNYIPFNRTIKSSLHI